MALPSDYDSITHMAPYSMTLNISSRCMFGCHPILDPNQQSTQINMRTMQTNSKTKE